MKYISIDIETTGLSPEENQILQIGAVIEDTDQVKELNQLPTFNCIVEHNSYLGQAGAIHLNSKIFKTLAELEKATLDKKLAIKREHNILPEKLVVQSFSMWLIANGFEPNKSGQIHITAAGKNFATFDKLFLEKLINWKSKIIVRQRILDPTCYFIDWKNDEVLPNLSLCKQRANLDSEVSHDALDDAFDVIKILRKVTYNYTKNLF